MTNGHLNSAWGLGDFSGGADDVGGVAGCAAGGPPPLPPLSPPLAGRSYLGAGDFSGGADDVFFYSSFLNWSTFHKRLH